MKAHSLERIGKDDEALQLCREVQVAKTSTRPSHCYISYSSQATNPTDDTVLSTMLLVYKAVGAADEAAVCYENAVKAQPENEEHAKG